MLSNSGRIWLRSRVPMAAWMAAIIGLVFVDEGRLHSQGKVLGQCRIIQAPVAARSPEIVGGRLGFRGQQVIGGSLQGVVVRRSTQLREPDIEEQVGGRVPAHMRPNPDGLRAFRPDGVDKHSRGASARS